MGRLDGVHGPGSKMESARLRECQSILFGIQILLLFQVAVASLYFRQLLDPKQRHLHLMATFLVAVTAALMVTPWSRHRRPAHDETIVARAVLAGRLSFMFCMLVDLYFIGWMILKSQALALSLSVLLAIVCTGVWFIPPFVYGRRHYHYNG
ncbi:DUF6328 family protein [Nitrospira sp. KM1]|uniref:DUF6328 family protein n=1 Tax=Nitrospira sp. KM1 TaxID=1936990 RepID=UPI001563D8F9|nr:DUF6328 family protein [Nitrospira sp. KM1]